MLATKISMLVCSVAVAATTAQNMFIAARGTQLREISVLAYGFQRFINNHFFLIKAG